MSYLSIKTTSSIENMSNKNNIKSRIFKFLVDKCLVIEQSLIFHFNLYSGHIKQNYIIIHFYQNISY